jgi:hypothetical protein
MASNITQNEIPYLWTSANDNCKFSFDFKPLLMNGIGDDSGKAFIQLFGTFDVIPTVGEYIYITSPLYNGTYKILDVTGSNIVTLDTAYLGTITSDTYFCYHLRVPVFTLYKGFDVGEGGVSFNSKLPYTKVIDIKPSVMYNKTTGIPYLEINVKGSIKYIFTIEPLTPIASEIYFNSFNAIRLTWDGTSTVQNTDLTPQRNYVFVLNSAISNDELIENYISATVDGVADPLAQRYLVPTYNPIIPQKGVSYFSAFGFYSEITGFEETLPIVYKFIDGVKQ